MSAHDPFEHSPSLRQYRDLFLALGCARLPVGEFWKYQRTLNRLQGSMLSLRTVPDRAAFDALMEQAFARLREIALDERGVAVPDLRFEMAYAALCRAQRMGEQLLPEPE